MARFIAVVIEFPDPNDEDGTKPLKQKTYFVSPLKVSYLKDFRDVLNKLKKKTEEDEKNIADDPDFVADRFDGLDIIGELLFKLVTVKHKKLTKEEFEDDFAISDYAELFKQLAAEVQI